jgi:hypothetical protein
MTLILNEKSGFTPRGLTRFAVNRRCGFIEDVASLLGQTSTWQADSQGKRPDFPSES